jgi:hypothetical protein
MNYNYGTMMNSFKIYVEQSFNNYKEVKVHYYHNNAGFNAKLLV